MDGHAILGLAGQHRLVAVAGEVFEIRDPEDEDEILSRLL